MNLMSKKTLERERYRWASQKSVDMDAGRCTVHGLPYHLPSVKDHRGNQNPFSFLLGKNETKCSATQRAEFGFYPEELRH